MEFYYTNSYYINLLFYIFLEENNINMKSITLECIQG